MGDNFTFGIEEEYFLVDAETKTVCCRMPEKFLVAAREATDGKVRGEFLQSQIEVATAPQTSLMLARAELRSLRQIVGAVAAEHRLGILAAGTHPTPPAGEAAGTPQDRHARGRPDLEVARPPTS